MTFRTLLTTTVSFALLLAAIAVAQSPARS